MLTKATRILEPGTFRYKLDELVSKLRNPYANIKWIKETCQNNRTQIDNNYVTIYIDFPTEREEKGPVLNWDSLPEVLEDKSEKNSYLRPDTYFLDGDKRYNLCDRYYNCHAYMCELKDDMLEYVTYVPRKGWIKVGVYCDTAIDKWSKKHKALIEIDKKVLKKAKMNLKLANIVSRPLQSVYRFLHTIDSSYLCLKYPFLYTRNRFDDKHWHSYKLERLLDRLEKKSALIKAHVKWPVNQSEIPEVTEEPKVFEKITEKDDYPKTKVYSYYIVLKDETEYEVYNQTGNWKGSYNPIKYKGKYLVWNSYTKLFCVINDINDYEDLTIKKETATVQTRFYDIVFNHTVYRIYSFLKWAYEKPFQVLFGIPGSSEIDAMDRGWFRAFGIKMLDELKSQLKKEKRLKDFRITQIKEKFGGLRFYTGPASEEIYNIISKYEDESMNTCIDCGKPARYITSGYILPYCEDCIPEDSKLLAKDLNNPSDDEDEEDYFCEC